VAFKKLYEIEAEIRDLDSEVIRAASTEQTG
jgi:hypothetical protein